MLINKSFTLTHQILKYYVFQYKWHDCMCKLKQTNKNWLNTNFLIILLLDTKLYLFPSKLFKIVIIVKYCYLLTIAWNKTVSNCVSFLWRQTMCNICGLSYFPSS